VIIKARVLDGEDGVLHVWRNLFVLERDALLERELSDNCLAVVSINSRDYAGPIRRQGGDLRGGLGIVQLIRRDDARENAGR